MEMSPVTLADQSRACSFGVVVLTNGMMTNAGTHLVLSAK